MIKLYLVRHGENKANITGEFSYRRIDYSLTTTGKRQAEVTRKYFEDKGINFNKVFSSPLKRAKETTRIIEQNTDIVILEGLRELNVGELENPPNPTTEKWQEYKRVEEEWRKGNKSFKFRGGESYIELLQRITDDLRYITDNAKDEEKILIVGHGGIFTNTIADICNIPEQERDSGIYNKNNLNCSITEVEYNPANREFKLIHWAYSQHIEDACIRTTRENINYIINDSLKDAPEPMHLEGDKFIIGDVHGRLDVLIQNLYMLGIVDKKGKLALGEKTEVIFQGDLINFGGPYSIETLLYAYDLQEQAQNTGSSVKLIFGNHEIDYLAMLNCYNKAKEMGQDPTYIVARMRNLLGKNSRGEDASIEDTLLLAEILAQNVERHSLYYSNDVLNIDIIHAGIEKGTRIKLLKNFCNVNMPESPNKKLSTSEIRAIMQNAGVTNEVVATKLNEDIRNNWNSFLKVISHYYCMYRSEDKGLSLELKEKYVMLADEIAPNKQNDPDFQKYAFIHADNRYKIDEFVDGSSGGLYLSLKKTEKSKSGQINDPENNSKKDKTLQIVAHIPTIQGDVEKGCPYYNCPVPHFYNASRGFTGRIHRTFFNDVNLQYGHQSICVINSRTKEVSEIFNTDRNTAKVIRGKRDEVGINSLKNSKWSEGTALYL